MKLSINKLIANDIINYGMNEASETYCNFSLDDYLTNFDDESKKYILDNIKEIIEDIEENENVADLVVETEDGDKEFDMIFYWGGLLTQIDKIVYEYSKVLKRDLDFDDIREITDELLDSEIFNSTLISKIKDRGGRDLD